MAKKNSRTKERARRAGAFMARGWKGTAFEGVVGAVAYHAQMKVAEASETVRSRWYVGPLALVAAGHFIKRRPRLAGIGAAMIGAGGYAFELNRSIVKQSEEQGGSPTGQTGGDTGSVIHGNTPAMLPQGNVVPFPSEQRTSEGTADVSAVMNLGRRRNRYR